MQSADSLAPQCSLLQTQTPHPAFQILLSNGLYAVLLQIRYLNSAPTKLFSHHILLILTFMFPVFSYWFFFSFFHFFFLASFTEPILSIKAKRAPHSATLSLKIVIGRSHSLLRHWLPSVRWCRLYTHIHNLTSHFTVRTLASHWKLDKMYSFWLSLVLSCIVHISLAIEPCNIYLLNLSNNIIAAALLLVQIFDNLDYCHSLLIRFPVSRLFS